jgi:serine/threonine-protein kinase RIO1
MKALRDYLERIRAEIVSIINDGLPAPRLKDCIETRKRIVRLYNLIEEAIKTIDDL